MTARRGFTLIELVVTVAIVGVLSMAAAPLLENSVRRDKEAALRHALREIRGAIDAYHRAAEEGRIARPADGGGWPTNLEALYQGVDDVRDPGKGKIFFLRRLPRDPFAPDAAQSAAQTWGKRSYASPPDDPREGVDVFDIHSLSAASGSNGIPYRQW